MKCFPKTMSASGLVYAGSCWFVNMKIGMDNANDVQLTVYDNKTAANGVELVPTNPYDASAMGLNGISGDESYAKEGVWLNMVAVGGGVFGGACEVTIGILPASVPDAFNPF